MKKHVLILGAGFAGLELATRLSESLADEVRVTLIDQSDSFSFGFSKLDVLLGGVRRPTFGCPTARSPRRGSSSAGTGDVHRPGGRRVETDADAYEADILAVALGAGYDLAATPASRRADSSSTRSRVPSACATRSRNSSRGGS